jgi:hypothetical protein
MAPKMNAIGQMATPLHVGKLKISRHLTRNIIYMFSGLRPGRHRNLRDGVTEVFPLMDVPSAGSVDPRNKSNGQNPQNFVSARIIQVKRESVVFRLKN